ncbi:WD40_repeat protein [Hexamita inflata]|uniref:WD40 repeat protein n=2 Tax=Hexamita inflata TaxID=28002 RepID=A0AA86UA41_9EUKA|nr:WD40 repeat protein [Hexamita inflata]
MYIQFNIKASVHNNKTPLFKFCPTDDIVAVASGYIVTIYAADGTKIDSFDTGANVIELSWSADGQQLLVLSQLSHLAYIWKPKQRITTKLTVEVDDPLCVDQSKQSKMLAIGSSFGHVFLYDSFTSSRATISSKHTKRIISLCFTHKSDNIVSMSPESLIVSNSKGDTIAYLKQKVIGGCFVNRVTAAQIKGPDGQFDAVIVPVLFDAAFQKKNKCELQNLNGLYLMVLNVDTGYITNLSNSSPTKEKVVDLVGNLRAQTYGNALLEIPTQNESETLLDLSYVGGVQTNFSPNVCLLLSYGNILTVSLDHSRQDMAISTADSKFKYFTIVSRRDSQFLNNNYQSYSVLLQEQNGVFGVNELANGNIPFQQRMQGCMSPCTSFSILSPIYNTNGLLVPYDKSVNIFDCQQLTQQEYMYVDFTGGKNSLGVIQNYPTNIQQSASGNVAFICLSNGSAMMLLTKNVSQCLVGMLEDVKPMDSCLIENVPNIGETQGQIILNLTSPKSVQISKLTPCKYSAPLVQTYLNEVMLPTEPTKLAVSQTAFAIYNNNQIQWSRINTDKELNVQLSWQSAAQPNVADLGILESNEQQLTVVRTMDGQVLVHAGGGLSTSVSTTGRSQTIKCCSPFIYTLSEKALLQVFCVEAEDDEIRTTLVSQMQLSNQFSGTAAGQNGEPVGCNKIDIMPGGCAVVAYKYNAKCAVQVFLTAEEILLDNVFNEEVSVNRILFDAALNGFFVAYIGMPMEKDVINSQELYTASLQFSVADRAGPAVLFKKQAVIKKDVSTLPQLLSNGIPLGLNNKAFTEFQPIPGIANVHASLLQLKSLPQIMSNNMTTFIVEQNPIVPVEKSIVNVVQQENQNVQIQLTQKTPIYKRIPLPSQLISFQKAVVELCNFGFVQLAFLFAARIQNYSLIKLVGDCCLRFTDFDTAKVCYNELSLKKIEGEFKNWEDYLFAFQGDAQQGTVQQQIYSDLIKCDFLKHLSGMNLTHNNDPAAMSLFIAKVCGEEIDLNTSMAYSLLMSCPDMENNQKQAEDVMDKAEQLLLKSNKPGLALSFRVDSLDWNTASVLAKKISSPYVRAEILIQQAGELETKQQFQEALDICMNMLKQGDQRLDIFSLPPHIQPLFIGIVSRCYCALGKVQECKDFAMPARTEGKYIQKPKDPLNILQRTRLCHECGETLAAQKRFADAAVFFEASAQLANQTFNKLNKEISQIATGETSLYDVVHGDQAQKMLMFTLLPHLKAKAESNYTQIMGKQEEDKYDIQLLRQIDTALENNQKKVVTATMPQKLGDVITTSDLAELDPPTILSKSANCYIKARLYDQAEKLIEYVTDKNTIADLARVFMRDDPEKALRLFKKAGKSIEIVECLLVLGKVADAESAVREVKTQLEKQIAQKIPGNEALILDLENECRQSALLLASHFRKANATKKSIYYYIQAEQYNDAFELSIQSKNEDLLIKYVTQKAPQDFLKKTAKYFASPDPESQEKKPRNMNAAARFLELSGSIDNAIKLLLNFGDGAGDIDRAIDLLRGCKSMVDYVLKYLQGGSDGVKKNPVYIFKLYLALDRFGQAAQTAFVLADRENEQGRFGRAKGLLLNCMQKLKTANQNRVPQKFRQQLILLHAIDTGRLFSKLELHYQAGLCLYRASKVASKFQDQACSILLSACVECWRAGDQLKRQAYECACVLLKDYEEEIPDKYRKSIDMVVRKYKKQTDIQQLMIKCCQCGAELIQGKLECDECQAILPLDSANGGQMSLADFCECPYCSWQCSRLGLYEVYGAEAIKKFETKCMMCNQVFDLNQVMLVDQGNYQLITGGQMNWEEYEYRPLIVYEDSNLARKRYEEWVKMWYADEE